MVRLSVYGFIGRDSAKAQPWPHKPLIHLPLRYDAPYNDSMSWLSPPPYLRAGVTLDAIFQVYDWNDDNGFVNFGKWVEAAARQAGL